MAIRLCICCGRMSWCLAIWSLTMTSRGMNPQFTNVGDSDKLQTIDIDFYRALTGRDVDKNKWENNDFADLLGAMKYVHTELIVEHEIGANEPGTNQPRQTRKYGADAIATWRFKLSNPVATKRHPLNVDFGPYTAYDFGQSTNVARDEDIKTLGDYVGVQLSLDPRMVTMSPYWWFSCTGPCPNLPFVSPQTIHRAPSDRCMQEFPAGCPGKYKDDKTTFSESCFKYKDSEDVIKGGLCPDSVESPTGERGCTYKYGKSKIITLDELVGITEEDCGGRKCKNWIDFRNSCTNPAYKQQFSGAGTRVPTSICVEYDIDHDCSGKCDDEKCKAKPEDEREIGLPFWRGRCDPLANMKRMEMAAKAFGIDDAETDHAVLAKDLRDQKQRCEKSAEGEPPTCKPALAGGGPYCTRNWGTVCQVCFIPGTSVPYGNPNDPMCPYNVLDSVDYKNFPKPTCASKKPSELCCLYTGTCDGVSGDVRDLPLNQDSLEFVRSLQNTKKMMAFLTSIAKASNLGVADASLLKDFAYGEWYTSPTTYLQLRDFTTVKTSLFASGAMNQEWTTTTTLETTAKVTTTITAAKVTTTITAAQVTTTSTAAPSGGMGPEKIALIIAIVAVIIALIFCVFLARRRRNNDVARTSSGRTNSGAELSTMPN